jgi:predicted secreted Zn-dependent protease
VSVLLYEPTWTSHDVHGHTLEEVAQHIEQLAEAGQTKWMPTYHAQEWDGATITRAQVDVQVLITMPHWVEYTTVSTAEQAEWDRFFEALRGHEQGHIELVNQYMENADTLLEGVDEHTAAHQWQSNLDALQAASDQYDLGNDHGRNAGTTIDLPEQEQPEAEEEEPVTF